jgi:hypothetical protein
MAWGTIPTAAGQLRFAKGRLRKFADRIEEGARLPGDDHHEPVDDRRGLTARFANGRVVVAYHRRSRWADERAEYAVLDREGRVVSRTTSLAGAVSVAVGGRKEFAVGHSKVTVYLYHRSGPNTLTLEVLVRAPNPGAEWDHQEWADARASTRDPETVRLAIGVLASGDDGGVHPLVDKIQEVLPGRIDRAVGFLFAEPVPAERLKKYEYRWDREKSEHARRVVYTTGRPVEGPDGQWAPG